MLLLPYKKLVVHSTVSSEAVSKILKQTVEPYVGYRFDQYSKSTKTYVGKVGDRTFSFRPVFSGRNSFVPRIVGTIVDTGEGTILNLTFRLHHVVTIGLLWMIGLLIFSVTKYGDTSALLFILFIYVMTIGFFNYEYWKAKRHLLKILKADAAPDELGRKFNAEPQANA
ncbi:MAG: hypothetical protein EOP48_14375 [Sphingobacteriales bacterium]|nr:MAG: hypothetical protein EOP48_14375 [Sphingobacteriales bacterium]